MTEKKKKKAVTLYKAGRKLREIAKEIGVSTATIKSHVAAHRDDYGRRNKSYTVQDFNKVAELLACGMTRKETAERLGITEVKVLSITISAANAARMSRKEWLDNVKQLKPISYEKE